MMRQAASRWFPPCRAEATAPPVLNADAIRLFCLPHAGAGASVYRDWPLLLAPGIEVVLVQLPGRESRHGEPAHRSASDLVAELSKPLADRAGESFALFGHSMGALLGYELAHALSALGKPPRHLFVSGQGAPHLPPARPPTHDLPDDELMASIAELEGTSAEVLAQPELVQLLLPVFRADLSVCETYIPHWGPLQVPITALGGRHDPGVSQDRLRAWRSLTSADFHLEVFDGGHFYLHGDALDDVAAVLMRRLSEPSPPQPGAAADPDTASH
jgi:surfactin synthase thioesterase subunit